MSLFFSQHFGSICEPFSREEILHSHLSSTSFHHCNQLQCISLPVRRLMTKPTKWHMRPAKTQLSLGIRPVWSESSLFAWRKFGSLATHWVHSEDSDQTGRMPRLIWVFAGRTCHFAGFVTRRLCFLFLLLSLPGYDLRNPRDSFYVSPLICLEDDRYVRVGLNSGTDVVTDSCSNAVYSRLYYISRCSPIACRVSWG